MESYTLLPQRGVRLRSEPSGLKPPHVARPAGHSPPPHVLFAVQVPARAGAGRLAQLPRTLPGAGQ